MLDCVGPQLKQPVLDLMGSSAVADVEATFDNISELYDAHHQFVTDLDKTASEWSPQTSVGEHLKILVSFGCIFYRCTVQHHFISFLILRSDTVIRSIR